MGHFARDGPIGVTLDDLNEVAAAAADAVTYLKSPPDARAWADVLDQPIGSTVGPFTIRGRLDGELEHEARLALENAAWQLVIGQRRVDTEGAWILYANAVVLDAQAGWITLTWPGPGLSRFLDGRHGPGRSAATTALRAIDHYSAGPVVAVDASWAPAALRDAARAQFATWVLARSIPVEPGGATWRVMLADDGLRWLQGWARRVIRSPDAPDVADLLAVASRALRAGSPAGHRRYWKAKLSRDRGGIMADALAALASTKDGPLGEDALSSEAADMRTYAMPAKKATEARPLGQMTAFGQPLGRTAAYERLRRAGKRADDFPTPQALATWLADHAPAPAKPPIAPRRRAMVATLVDRKWTPEAARRLERRWRLLPPDEQLARLNRLLVRRGYDPLPTGDA